VALTRRPFVALLLCALGLIAWFKADGSKGTDIHVYLYAAETLAAGGDIYGDNPFNRYLYSPLFALLLQPITALDGVSARFLWLVVNGLAGIRVFVLFGRLAAPALPVSRRARWATGAGALLFALEPINMNFNLGQITLLILWLTVEGCLLLLSRRIVRGAALLALGINIKIVPLMAVVYLLFRRAWRSAALCVLLTALTLLLPAVQLGWHANLAVHARWLESINPSRAEYRLEMDNGCQSLSCLLPAYLLEPGEHDEFSHGFSRKIARLAPETVVALLGAARIAVVLALLVPILDARGRRELPGLHTWRELAALLLVSLLVFPHQMSYVMVYAAPAVAYLIAFALLRRERGTPWRTSEWLPLAAAAVPVLLSTIQGRDLIGHAAVDVFRFYRVMGVAAVACLVALIWLGPGRVARFDRAGA
jgi:hypothetical protein